MYFVVQTVFVVGPLTVPAAGRVLPFNREAFKLTDE